MTKDHLNKVRAAIIALDRAANRLPIVERSDRLLHTELQDAADGLVEVREDISVLLEIKENMRKAMAR
jgi:hypothetical protein